MLPHTVKFSILDWEDFDKNIKNQQAQPVGNEVETFNNLMDQAGHKVKVWQNGSSYYNDYAQLMWMKRQKFWRLQLVGADPADYPSYETSKLRGKSVPHLDFSSDGAADVLKNHLGM